MADKVKKQEATEPKAKEEAQADEVKKQEADDKTLEADAEPETAVYTQADMDSAIEKRLARERRKMPSKEEMAEFKAWKAEKEPPAEDKALANEKAKAEALEFKIACYEAGVKKDSVEAVTAIAEKLAKKGDVDMEEAIEQVLAKYPAFNDTSSNPTEPKAWARRHQEEVTPLSGVEESFFKLNPRLKQ